MTTRYHTANHSLHVVESEVGFSIWLNLHDIDYSGLCVGTGETRSQAVQAAISTLQTCIDVLERPPMNRAICWLCKGTQTQQIGGIEVLITCRVCDGTGRLL